MVRFVHRPAPEDDSHSRKRKAEEGEEETKTAKDEGGKEKRISDLLHEECRVSCARVTNEPFAPTCSRF